MFKALLGDIGSYTTESKHLVADCDLEQTETRISDIVQKCVAQSTHVCPSPRTHTAPLATGRGPRHATMPSHASRDHLAPCAVTCWWWWWWWGGCVDALVDCAIVFPRDVAERLTKHEGPVPEEHDA